MAGPGSSGQIDKYFESGWSIWRNTPGKDASGGLVKTWTKYKDVVGRLAARSGSFGGGLNMTNNKMTETHSLRFYCPVEVIRAGDEIRKGTKRYEVMFSNNVMEFGVFMQVDVQEVI